MPCNLNHAHPIDSDSSDFRLFRHMLTPSALRPAVAPFTNLLPGFTTPECEAELRIDGAADSEQRLYFMARVELGNSIELGYPALVTFKGKKDDTGVRASGPEFGITVMQATKDDGLAVDVFFDSEVCVKLGADVCLDVHASLGCDGGSNTPGDDAGCNFELAGAYTGGDIKPLEAVGVLPPAVKDAFTILANDDMPVELALTAVTSPASLGFSLEGGFEIDLTGMNMGTLAGTVQAGGTLSGGGVAGERRAGLKPCNLTWMTLHVPPRRLLCRHSRACSTLWR